MTWSVVSLACLCVYFVTCMFVCACSGECGESEGQVGELHGGETAHPEIGKYHQCSAHLVYMQPFSLLP